MPIANMQQYNAEKDSVIARKVNATLNSYEDTIARINARFAAAKAAKTGTRLMVLRRVVQIFQPRRIRLLNPMRQKMLLSS